MPATRKEKAIPLHRLEDTTDTGFFMDWVRKGGWTGKDAVDLGIHRDDHYIFLFQEGGSSRFMMDFGLYNLRAGNIFFILPGQVHQALATRQASGYFMALDAAIIPAPHRKVFEDPLLRRQPLPLTGDASGIFLESLRLLYRIYTQEPRPAYYEAFVRGHLSSALAMLADAYSRAQSGEGPAGSRVLQITQQFRSLLAGQYKTLKSPGEYAAALHLSLSYLNEVVKESTGFPVSYWIQYEIMLEAKRLLYHSEYSVKEVAYELGYEDPAYFSRLFRKAVQQTPGEFRRQYRE